MNKKLLLIILVVVIIGYNVIDFIRVKKHKNDSDLKQCVNQFVENNKVTESIAQKYCECVLESLQTKYKNSNLSSDEIKEKEKTVFQNCYDQAVASERP